MPLHCLCHLVPFNCATEAAEVLFDHGLSKVYTACREELAQPSTAHHHLQSGTKAPSATTPVAESAIEAKQQAAVSAIPFPGKIGNPNDDEGEGQRRGKLPRRHHHPPLAAPAAAAEPAGSADSVPSGKVYGGTAAGGAAAYGFAAVLAEDVAEEVGVLPPPPQASDASPK